MLLLPSSDLHLTSRPSDLHLFDQNRIWLSLHSIMTKGMSDYGHGAARTM